MKLAEIMFFLIFFNVVSYSQETIEGCFFKHMDLTPELIQKLRARPETDISYNFVKYKIVDENLFKKIADVSIKSMEKELSKRKRYKDGVTISHLRIYIIKLKGLTYLCVEYNPYAKFSRPDYDMMKQPAGFTNYRGVIYELVFWNSAPQLFLQTKQFKRIVYKESPNIYKMHFESGVVYLQIKDNEVKVISGDTIIK